MKRKMTTKERQKAYEKGYTKLLNDLEMGVVCVVEFPNRVKTPVLSWLALKIIERQGGYAALRFTDLRK